MTAWKDRLLSGAAVLPIRRDRFVADGVDTVKFLQGQLTQDVAAMPVGSTRWSLLLAPNGRVIALLRLLRSGEDTIIIDTEAGVGETARAALARFLIRTKCTLSPVESITGSRGVGGDVPSIGTIPMHPWLGYERFEGNSVHVEILDETVAAIWRVIEGMPAHGVELLESTIPSESGLVDAAVTFGKGCYVGQELVERIDSRGRVVKRLVRVSSQHSLQPGDQLFLETAAVGTVSSAVELDGTWFAIAMLKTMAADRAANEITLHTAAGVDQQVNVDGELIAAQ
jgi:tRNA-modifying protein YgfZ